MRRVSFALKARSVDIVSECFSAPTAGELVGVGDEIKLKTRLA